MTFDDAVEIGLGLRVGRDYPDPLTSREQAEREAAEREDDLAAARYQASLEQHARTLWTRTDNGHRDLLHRLDCLIRTARMVQKRAPEGRLDHESDYAMDLLLTEWGPAKLFAYFSALAAE